MIRDESPCLSEPFPLDAASRIAALQLANDRLLQRIAALESQCEKLASELLRERTRGSLEIDYGEFRVTSSGDPTWTKK
jgi:hypothetical protein